MNNHLQEICFDIIENKIHWIQDNNFELLYSYLLSSYTPKDIGGVSEILLSADINPLNYMLAVPKHFLTDSTLITSLESIHIPEGIRGIGGQAFYMTENTNIKYLKLPSTIEELGHLCFSRSSLQEIDLSLLSKDISINSGTFLSCKSLQKLILPKQCYLEARSFQNTPKLKVIMYPGTKEEFHENIVFENEWRWGVPITQSKVIVKFNDGDKELIS